MILLLILLTSFSLSELVSNITKIELQTESDPATIRTMELVSDKGFENASDARELYLKVPMTDSEMESVLELQNPDGSWRDINYGDTNPGSWHPSLHAFRIHRLAIRYASLGDERALAAAISGIRFWNGAGIVSRNWWHNEIGIPRLLGPAFVLLKDKMDKETLQGAVRVMSAAGFRQTGQNKIWQAGGVLLRAVLQDDAALVEEARNVILSELEVCEGREGLQPDGSFHQHGPQLQFGNYGLSYAVTLSWWARVFENTGLDLPADKMEMLRSYVAGGLCPLVWKGWYDHNACGRQVFPNAQIAKALCVRSAAANLGLKMDPAPGGRYFPYSDFGVFIGKGWYASIRMQSVRTKGYETTNRENMKGYFSADGALLVRVDGDEYHNVSPFWEWHHVPGVTSWDDGTPIWGNRNGPGHTPGKDEGPYNKSGRVCGKVGDGCMVAAMEYDRDTLSARKAYFFFEDGVVCLGAGITKPGRSRVTTTIEQNLLRGEVKQGRNWAAHRNISYLLLSDCNFSAGAVRHSGQWKWMSPALSSDEVSGDVFEMVIDHGVAPKDASYAYAVLPGITLNDRTARRQDIKVLSNTPRLQSVRIAGKTMAVRWEPSGVEIELP